MYKEIQLHIQFPPSAFQAVDDYKKSERKMKQLKAELERQSVKLEEHTDLMADAKTKWREPLGILVSEINKHFSHFFRKLDCAGEIDLSVPENPVCKCFF